MANHLTRSGIQKFVGQRVRVIYNPSRKLWYVYTFEEAKQDVLFMTKRLALHLAAIYGDLKPKFAPEGAPSFVGTISLAEPSITKSRVLKSHPNAPSKIFFDGDVEEFHFSQHLLLDGPAMYACERLYLGK